MERIRHAAEFSIRRALGFTGLAIAMVMLGLSFDPALAFKSGAVLMLIAAVVLAYKAWSAPTRNVRETEVWILIGDRIDLPREVAQRVIGGVLRELYQRYTRWTLVSALTIWLVGFLIGLVFEPQPLR